VTSNQDDIITIIITITIIILFFSSSLSYYPLHTSHRIINLPAQTQEI